MCDCEFTPDPNDPDDDWHFLRTCRSCGGSWFALHCPHDGHQRPCPNCGVRPSAEAVTSENDSSESIGNE